MFSKGVCISLIRLLPIRVQCTWACPSSNAVSHKKFPLVSFFIFIRYRHTPKKTRNQFEVALSNSTALLAAPLQSSAQSLPNSLSGKDITMQTLRLAHRLNLRLIDVLGGGIAERARRRDNLIFFSSGTKQKYLDKIIFVVHHFNSSNCVLS